MARVLIALVAAAFSVLAGAPPAAAEAPESVTNRKIRQMNQIREERRQADEESGGAYSDYSIPDPGQRAQRGYYSSRGGSSPANAGGNAFGRDGAAFPSDGGSAFPAVPPNK